MYRNKAGLKIRKKTNLLQDDGRKERQDDYPTPDATGVGQGSLVVYSFPPSFFCRVDLLLLFIPALFLYFLQVMISGSCNFLCYC